MFTIEKYTLAESLSQAYEIIKERGSVVLGGTMWMKMGSRRIQHAVDLSGLSLNEIHEEDEFFRIGAMTSLRAVEVHEGLNECFQDVFKESLRHIVGVQFRNGATMGGSVYGKFGFSDVLTVLLALDTQVELFNMGTLPLKEFLEMKTVSDILVNILIRKDGRTISYETLRKSATDFPVLACAVSHLHGEWKAVLGARPGVAKAYSFNGSSELTPLAMEEAVQRMKEEIPFGTNYLGSKEYREILSGVLMKRNMEKIIGGQSWR